MFKLWRIAVRDLGRNKRRSALTLIAVALGLALVIALQALGHEVGWGFQLQNRAFLIFMVALACSKLK